MALRADTDFRMAEYRVQGTVEATVEVAQSSKLQVARWRASMPALRGGDAWFFAAQRPHRKKFMPAGIAT